MVTDGANFQSYNNVFSNDAVIVRTDPILYNTPVPLYQ